MSSSPKRSPSRCRSRSLLELPSIVTLAAALLSLSPMPAAATTPNAAAELKKTLAAEPEGSAVSRDEQLAKVIESAPDCAPARWAAGYVEHEGKWIKFDSAAGSDRENEKLAEYRRMRDEAPDTAEGHLKIANWCRQHGLKDQERAPAARARFGAEPE